MFSPQEQLLLFFFFFLPGHLLAKPRRKIKGKTQEEGKAEMEKRKMMLVERRKRNVERRRLNALPMEAATREPINAH